MGRALKISDTADDYHLLTNIRAITMASATMGAC